VLAQPLRHRGQLIVRAEIHAPRQMGFRPYPQCDGRDSTASENARQRLLGQVTQAGKLINTASAAENGSLAPAQLNSA
jgi:hypothetical protein